MQYEKSDTTKAVFNYLHRQPKWSWFLFDSKEMIEEKKSVHMKKMIEKYLEYVKSIDNIKKFFIEDIKEMVVLEEEVLELKKDRIDAYKKMDSMTSFIYSIMDCVKLMLKKYEEGKEYDIVALQQYLDKFNELKEKKIV